VRQLRDLTRRRLQLTQDATRERNRVVGGSREQIVAGRSSRAFSHVLSNEFTLTINLAVAGLLVNSKGFAVAMTALVKADTMFGVLEAIEWRCEITRPNRRVDWMYNAQNRGSSFTGD
jgi:hypothetical protein